MANCQYYTLLHYTAPVSSPNPQHSPMCPTVSTLPDRQDTPLSLLTTTYNPVAADTLGPIVHRKMYGNSRVTARLPRCRPITIVVVRGRRGGEVGRELSRKYGSILSRLWVESEHAASSIQRQNAATRSNVMTSDSVAWVHPLMPCSQQINGRQPMRLLLNDA